MTDSATGSKATSTSEVKAMRIDPPHDIMLANHEDEPATPWMAIAGLDPSASSDQLDRQTSELLAYVQQQNDEIDLRQAELNAKLAQLDNELRAARLRATRDAGVELVSSGSASSAMPADSTGEVLEGVPSDGISSDAVPQGEMELDGMSATNPVDLEPAKDISVKNGVSATDMSEFEEVTRIVAQFAGDKTTTPSDSDQADDRTSKDAGAINELEAPSLPTKQSSKVLPHQSSPSDTPKETASEDKRFFRIDGAHELGERRRDLDKVPLEDDVPPNHVPIQDLHSRNIGRSDLDLELQAMATSLDASEMESERRLLAERKIELDRRKSVLHRMQSETQALHREALEMRLVTEQLWIEISEKAPPEHVNELLTSLRARLDQHYVEQQKEIEEQANELVSLKESIEQKQEDLRLQSNQLQQWVETRHDEIKSYAAEVDARELLLDRREHRMREEFSKWEAARATYQQQLQGLLGKLDK